MAIISLPCHPGGNSCFQLLQPSLLLWIIRQIIHLPAIFVQVKELILRAHAVPLNHFCSMRIALFH